MLSLLVDACVRRRNVVFGLVLAFALIGYRAYRTTPVEAFPDVTNLQVNVVTPVAGLAPPEVERQVTIPLERAINGTPGLVGVRSESLFGLSLVYLTFEDGIEPFRARSSVEQRMRTADLPEGVVPRLGADATPLGEIFLLRLESDRHSTRELRSEAEWNVAPRLRRVPGVADVVTRGGYLDELHVEVDPERLEAYGISLADVREALEGASRNVGGGFLAAGDQQFVVRGVGQLAEARELMDVVIRDDDGIPITLGDLARIVSSHVPRQGASAYGRGDESVEAAVLMRRGENPSRVLAAVHAAVDELGRDGLPAGMRIVPFYDRASLVDRTLSTVHRSLIEGAFLCVGVVWLFLRSLRGSLIVAAVIPLSLLVAFVSLHLVDLPANLISMGAIDFGILVDGGVILVENVMHRMAARPPADEEERVALVAEAAKESATPIFFAMAIIIAALVPVFALESVEGRIFRPLALTYSFALVGALLFSLTLVPSLCAALLRDGGESASHEPTWLDRFGEVHGAVLRGLRARPSRTALALVGVLATTGIVGARLGREFLPELDEGDFTVFVELPSSTSLDVARGVLKQVRERLLRHPEVREVSTKLGRPEDGTDNESVNMSLTYVHLVPPESFRPGMTKERLYAGLRTDLGSVPGIRFNFSQPIRDSVEESISGVRGKVVLKIFGDDLEVMRGLLLDALEAVRGVPGVIEASLYRDRSVPQLEVVPDRGRIASRGLAMASVLDDVETAIAGTVVGELWRGERLIPIRLRYPASERDDATRIGDLVVVAPDGGRIPLRELARIEITPGRASINRDDGRRSLSLKFNIEGRDSGSVVRDAIAAVNHRIRLPDGYQLRWGGEFENQERAMKRLSVVVPIALAIVFGLLALALRSLRGALSVLLVLPWALSGGVFALALGKLTFSVSAAIGFIALLGQVSLASLLVIEAIEGARGVSVRFLDEAEARTHSRGWDDAALVGACSRLRPVLMTSLLAMLGLLPMALSTAPGSETQRPFALVMVGGMATTCAVVLLVLPLVHAAIARRVEGLRGERADA